MINLLDPVDDVLMMDSMFYVSVSRGEWDKLGNHNFLSRHGPKLFVSDPRLLTLRTVDKCGDIQHAVWRRIIFPIHEGGDHWVCACLDFEERTATIYDSLARHAETEVRTMTLEVCIDLFSDIRHR